MLFSAEFTVSKHSAENLTFPPHFGASHLSNQSIPFIPSKKKKKIPLKLAKNPWNRHTQCNPKGQKVTSFNCGVTIRYHLENTQIQFILMLAKCFTYPPAITPKRSNLHSLYFSSSLLQGCSQSQFNSSHGLSSLQWYLSLPMLKTHASPISVNPCLTCWGNIRNPPLSDLSTSHPNHYKILSQ